ncbi:MAG TPA: ABC transporter permease [Thermoanaerobaculia bacterium]|nr:ABC transporter permease [Thermoanaerobaculia bacterium]
MRKGAALLRHEIFAVLAAMRRRPFVPLLAMAMLAVAIAANIAVFTVISRTLLRPLRYSRPEELLAISSSHIQPDRSEVDEPSSDLEFVNWKARTTTFRDMQAVKPLGMTLTGSGDPESVDGAWVSGGIFRFFGVRPILGRDFVPEDDVPDSHAVIISYGLWQRRFGGNGNVLSQTVFVDGGPHTVIGVLPRTFEIPTVTADLFIPEGLSPSHIPNPRAWNYTLFGRLRQGASAKQALTDLRRVSSQLQKEFAEFEKNKSARVKSLHEAAFGDQRPALLILAAAVFLVQLLACVNVANLLLARINDQRGVTALRLVLGANRWQLMRLRVIEGLVITVAGAIAGRLLASMALRVLLRNQPALAESVESPWTVPLFVVAVIAITTIVISIVPALREARTSLSTVLNEGSQRASSSIRGTRARQLFVISQVALAVPLLLGATAAVDRFRQLRHVDLGFDPHHVFTAQLILPPRYASQQDRTGFVRELVSRMRAIPGVTDAAVTTNLFTRGQSAGTFAMTDRFPELVSMAMRRITPTYFDTMRIRLTRGRAFNDQDELDSPPVAIVSEALAKRFWPGEDAMGKRIRRTPPQPWLTIVGIAPDVRDEGTTNEVGPTLYVPYLQGGWIYVSIVVRTAGDPAAVRDPVRRAVWSIDRNLTPSAEKPLRQIVDSTVDPERLQADLFSSFAIIALLLATTGIYAVTAYAVSQRTREIGVRLAFGATPGTISTELLRRAASSVAIGLAAGLVIAFVVRHVQSFVAYGAGDFGIAYAVGVCSVLFATAIVASFIPALRARRVEPAALLRDA